MASGSRVVIDYEASSISFKDDPRRWYKLPTTDRGLMLIPLTKEACHRLGGRGSMERMRQSARDAVARYTQRGSTSSNADKSLVTGSPTVNSTTDLDAANAANETEDVSSSE